MNGAVPPLFQQDFMAWCSVQGKTKPKQRSNDIGIRLAHVWHNQGVHPHALLLLLLLKFLLTDYPDEIQ
jgi:hypothetical protein